MQYTTYQAPSNLIGQSHKSGITWAMSTAMATMLSNISGVAPMADHPVMQAALICIGVVMTIWAQKAASDELRATLHDALSEANENWVEAQILGHRRKFELSRQYRQKRAGRSTI